VPPRPATGTIVRRDFVRLATKREVDEVSDRFYVYDNALPAQYAVDWYRLRITSSFVAPDGQETPIETIVQVFLPHTDQQAEFPLYVFGPGTTGLVGDCAPSREQPTERSWGDFEAYLMSYAAQGYVAIMPDFEGFDGGPRIHHYYVAELEARVLLDAARAGLRFFDGDAGANLSTRARGANAVFFGGYSQGGHAALAARDAAPRYAPELHVMGAIGYGPRGDVQTLLQEMPGLAPYLLYAYADYYGADQVDAGQVLLPPLFATLERDVKRLCIDEVLDYYGYDPKVVFQPRFADALAHDRLGEEYPALKALLDRNNVGLTPGGAPVLVVQGLADTVVEPATQRAFVRRLCAVDVKVTLIQYEGIPHVLTRQVSIDDTTAWMQAIQQGGPTQVACGKV
jgi:hypothetical protein